MKSLMIRFGTVFQAHCFLMYRWIKLDVVWGHDLNVFCSGSKPVQSQVDILSCHILPCITVIVHLIPEKEQKETGFLPSLVPGGRFEAGKGSQWEAHP